MFKKSEIQLKDLVGEHCLTGVDRGSTTAKNGFGCTSDTANCINFQLDGKVYQAIEDPSDGYRSYMDSICEVTDNVSISNKFPEVRVYITHKEDHCDLIEMIDVVSNNIIFTLGTKNTNDYYPYCVMEWSPEKIYYNMDKYKEKNLTNTEDKLFNVLHNIRVKLSNKIGTCTSVLDAYQTLKNNNIIIEANNIRLNNTETECASYRGFWDLINETLQELGYTEYMNFIIEEED